MTSPGTKAAAAKFWRVYHTWGWSLRVVGEHFGCSHTHVSATLRAHGYRLRGSALSPSVRHERQTARAKALRASLAALKRGTP